MISTRVNLMRSRVITTEIPVSEKKISAYEYFKKFGADYQGHRDWSTNTPSRELELYDSIYDPESRDSFFTFNSGNTLREIRGKIKSEIIERLGEEASPPTQEVLGTQVIISSLKDKFSLQEFGEIPDLIKEMLKFMENCGGRRVREIIPMFITEFPLFSTGISEYFIAVSTKVNSSTDFFLNNSLKGFLNEAYTNGGPKSLDIKEHIIFIKDMDPTKFGFLGGGGSFNSLFLTAYTQLQGEFADDKLLQNQEQDSSTAQAFKSGRAEHQAISSQVPEFKEVPLPTSTQPQGEVESKDSTDSPDPEKIAREKRYADRQADAQKSYEKVCGEADKISEDGAKGEDALSRNPDFTFSQLCVIGGSMAVVGYGIYWVGASYVVGKTAVVSTAVATAAITKGKMASPYEENIFDSFPNSSGVLLIKSLYNLDTNSGSILESFNLSIKTFLLRQSKIYASKIVIGGLTNGFFFL